ncbi:HpcH/HpaI aldolase/citrate lyase family protein [Jannaschia sp. CCS1]|uniref:HpcH/HpaI aldolase/citrate lyase family protein n=1 Tax=Jannaschia sp. (strain CCS1) TaxID=290400 RepID=UPI0002FE5C6B|nr:CoA ester lyase [Jannaschia sp. CCS1]
MSQPCRSVLYIPASRARAMEKARTLPVDAIIFDLEDAVVADEKVAARDTLIGTLNDGDFGPRQQIIRINGFDTQWGADDLNAIARAAPQAVLLPKVDGASDIEALAVLLDAHPQAKDTRIWAMMETPLGILNAAEIACAPRMAGFVMGTNDLAKDLTARTRDAMQTSLQLCVLAARAHGILCVDGVYNAFKDDDGLRAECQQGRDFGFDGKTLIHPAQIAIANATFGPTEQDIALARRQIEAYEAALTKGEGVAVVDGKIVENLHVETARATLAKSEAIAALETA